MKPIKVNPQILKKYSDMTSQYEKLGQNISQALQLLLKENEISYLSINYRVKESDSFFSKIERKLYKNPFDEVEDICGIRIICYYQSDVEKIEKIIKQEFDVLENENKVESLEFDQFGYRSTHFILKIKKNWFNTPNYRGLEDLKAEVQIRTVLMHAWAEIEHKLAYKSDSQVPAKIRRKLSRISAKLEESDEQFEEIKVQIEENKNDLIKNARKSKQFNENVDFNLDSLQAFLDYAFPKREKLIKETSALFEEMLSKKVSLKTLVTGFEIVKDIIPKLEKDIVETYEGTKYDEEKAYLMQVGAARAVLELYDDDYYMESVMRDDLIDKYRSEVNKNATT